MALLNEAERELMHKLFKEWLGARLQPTVPDRLVVAVAEAMKPVCWDTLGVDPSLHPYMPLQLLVICGRVADAYLKRRQSEIDTIAGG